MRPRLLAVMIALVPALVIAAPRTKKKRGKTKPKPAPSEPAPAPEPTPAPVPEATGSAAPKPAAGSATAAPSTPQPAAGSGSAVPEPSRPAEPPPPPEPKDADVDSLRQEYLALRDELFKSRARANTIASQLYSSRIQIKLTYTTGRFYNPAKAQIRLDGASVYDNTTGAIATDDGIRFEGYVAPGRHVITFRIEATAKDDDTFTTATESSIVVKAVPNKDLIVAAKAKDGGDIAYEWKKKEKGSYDLGLDVSVKTVARAEAKK